MSRAVPESGGARQALLDSAVRLLAAGGRERATARAICAEVGVRAPSLYHHYGSLDALHQAAIDRAFAEVAACYPADTGNTDPVQHVRDSWRMFMRFAESQPRLARIVIHQIVNGEVPPRVLHAFDDLVTNLGRLAEHGRLGTTPQHAAQVLWATAIGAAALTALATEDTRLDRGVSATILEALLGGLVREAGRPR